MMMPAVRAKAARAWRRAKRIGLRPGDAPVILMYHRIAEPPFDPFGLSVAPGKFAAQLAWLSAHRQLLAMDALVAALEANELPPRATAVTFDDGYADNAATAAPMLADAGCPATVFVTTGAIGTARPFWWDDLAARVLGSLEAADFAIEPAGIRLAGRWSAQDDYPSDLSAWRVGLPARDARRAAYLALWTGLQRADPAAREQAMAGLRAVLPLPRSVDAETLGSPMDAAAVRGLAAAGIAVGGHAQTHAGLPLAAEAIQRNEIAGGRRALAELSGQEEPTGFAYPHGEWNRLTRRLVGEAGYRWAVTTREEVVDPRRWDRFTLPRLAVGNWSADELARQLAAVGT